MRQSQFSHATPPICPTLTWRVGSRSWNRLELKVVRTMQLRMCTRALKFWRASADIVQTFLPLKGSVFRESHAEGQSATMRCSTAIELVAVGRVRRASRSPPTQPLARRSLLCGGTPRIEAPSAYSRCAIALRRSAWAAFSGEPRADVGTTRCRLHVRTKSHPLHGRRLRRTRRSGVTRGLRGGVVPTPPHDRWMMGNNPAHACLCQIPFFPYFFRLRLRVKG